MKSIILMSFILLQLENCTQEDGYTFGRGLRDKFLLNKDFIQLNHGSYGTYPKAVQLALHALQTRAEGNPDIWIRRDVRKEMELIRIQLAHLISSPAEDIVVIPNTTSGMNAVLRSLIFKAGDRILHLSSTYEAMQNIIKYVCDSSNENVTSVEFSVQFPISNEEIVQRFEFFLENNGNIRLALIDHISSSPAVIWPIEQMIPILKKHGILVLVDGAHALGQIPVNVTALAPDFYVADTHKWLFTPRSSGILYVDKKHQKYIYPATISYGYSIPSNFQAAFFFVGTIDYTPYLAVTAALKFRDELGGEAAIKNYCHKLAWDGGLRMAGILGTRILQSENQMGNMVDVQLPIDDPHNPALTNHFWMDTLLYRTNTYVNVYKHNGQFWARVSAQVYTDMSDFEYGARILKLICEEINSGKICYDYDAQKILPKFEI